MVKSSKVKGVCAHIELHSNLQSSTPDSILNNSRKNQRVKKVVMRNCERSKTAVLNEVLMALLKLDEMDTLDLKSHIKNYKKTGEI